MRADGALPAISASVNDLAQAILLGVVQGLTEFLPVSSSGHLVLAQQALGDDFHFTSSAVVFDLVLHAGTLLPVLWFYRADLLRILSAFVPGSATDPASAVRDPANDRHLALAVVVATIPTALMGLLFKDLFESLFHSVGAVCIALLVTGGLLLSTRFQEGEDRPDADAMRSPISLPKALLIGLVQGLAITPGISRSGSTIATALLLGVPRADAARFSFLLSIPAICGAIVLMLKDGAQLGGMPTPLLAAGFTSAMVVGYLALVMLVALVKRGGLHRFTYYVWPVAVIAWFALG